MDEQVPSRPPLAGDAVVALSSLYEAERSDGSAIYASSIQILASMLIVAGIAASLLTTRFSETNPLAVLAVPVIAWGLASYTVVINALMSVRVWSIGEIEREMFSIVEGNGQVFAHRMASDVGDWVSRIGRQNWLLGIFNVFSFSIALLAVGAASAFVCVETAGDLPWGWTVFAGSFYGVMFVLVACGYGFVFGGPLHDSWRGTSKPG